MSIRVLFFAALAEAAGTREAEVPATGCTDVASLYSHLIPEFPGLEGRRMVLCAVNAEFARFDAPVHDGDEVAFFPPVSGG
jgi:molybdopterin converting factor subunit 1